MAETREFRNKVGSMRRVALVAGATGLVGRELVKSLLLGCQGEGLSAEWTAVYGVARRSDNDDDLKASFANYRFVRCDLLDREEVMEKLSPLAGSVTHLFWATWASQFPPDTPECCHQNRAMLSNALDAILDCAGPALCHVALQTGTSHYVSAVSSSAMNDDSFSLYDEESPRVGWEANNFYYTLEDLVRERLLGLRRMVGWSVHRPGLLLGASWRSHFNFIGSLCVYAAICSHMRLPFTFCGRSHCWEQPYMDASDARLVAHQQIWWASSAERRNGDGADGHAFNAVNDATFTWKGVWPVLASKFGLLPEGGTVVFSETLTYTGLMGDKGGAWEEIVEKEGLRRTTMEDLANWAFLDMVFRFPSRMLVSRGKARRMGFTTAYDGGVIDSILYWVDRMREERLIPWS